MIRNISPIDGRYKSKTKELEIYFSEFALMRYRLKVEIEYFIKLLPVVRPHSKGITDLGKTELRKIYTNFDESNALSIKEIEQTTNHDVKAAEYFVKEKLASSDLSIYSEFVHFGLTSQDINNTSLPLMIKEALEKVIVPFLQRVVGTLNEKAKSYKHIPMLARTHGQAASPTGVGKEILVFVERLENQLNILNNIKVKAKFGGATGNFNAHVVTYPIVDWVKFGNEFVTGLGLERSQHTTQIAHYDSLAEIFHCLSRINTILIDLSRDIWMYISMNYFKQKIAEQEVGSSAMPHKVNPIDFENAEGNLGMANAIFAFLAEKLPISRLQRDLTDSTVSRNVGTPFAHSLIAYKSLIKGLDKLQINKDAIHKDLEDNWAVVAEAIQSILRRENYPEPFEVLKAFSRGKGALKQSDFISFIEGLQVSDKVKEELKAITPFDYVGYATR